MNSKMGILDWSRVCLSPWVGIFCLALPLAKAEAEDEQRKRPGNLSAAAFPCAALERDGESPAIRLSFSSGDAVPPQAIGQNRYYMILFGGQAIPFRPRTAHTWAIFARASRQADGTLAVEWFTISWLPAEGPVRPLRLWPQPGKNYTLEETMRRAAEQKDRISMWGPYEISALRYELARQWFFQLSCGRVRYRVLDTLWYNPRIAHCVHAVTYADPDLKHRIQPVVRVGEPGTSRLAMMYVRAGAFLQPEITHDWLIPVIGLDRYPFVRRLPGERIPREFR
ncbi:MAG: hypothetical protein KatS3mg107_0194 [Gemmataceae bacterium]|jgi:hypothetical protein|nr:MAG: hypothetical protein KatS3mg107_0194 [Gemmataceae bacterium]